jgi:hypothetical protein
LKSYMYMIEYKRYENFNISEDEGIILTNYFEALALIGIEYLNNKKINKFSYDEKLFYME